MGVDFLLFLFIFNSPKNCNKEKNKKLCREIKNIFKKSQWKTIFSSSHPYNHSTTKKTRYTIHIHHSIYNWDVLKRRCYMLYSKQLFFHHPTKIILTGFVKLQKQTSHLLRPTTIFQSKWQRKQMKILNNPSSRNPGCLESIQFESVEIQYQQYYQKYYYR